MEAVSSFVKRAACAAVLALASAGVYAVDYAPGSIASGVTYFDVKSVPVGAFSDTFSFSIGTPIFAGGSLADLAISVAVPTAPLTPFSPYSSTGLNVKLFSGLVGSDAAVFDLDSNPLSREDYKAASGRFAVADHYFAVAGNAVGTLGGKYQFGVTAVAAPVPEPESYAMFLAGLGMMGAIAVRRNKKKHGA